MKEVGFWTARIDTKVHTHLKPHIFAKASRIDCSWYAINATGGVLLIWSQRPSTRVLQSPGRVLHPAQGSVAEDLGVPDRV